MKRRLYIKEQIHRYGKGQPIEEELDVEIRMPKSLVSKFQRIIDDGLALTAYETEGNVVRFANGFRSTELVWDSIYDDFLTATDLGLDIDFTSKILVEQEFFGRPE